MKLWFYYYLSTNTESSLDNYYDACLGLSSECKVVQNLIHESEGYINYNSTEPIAYDPTNYDSTGMSNPEYNLITNEYCKKINNQNDCDQIKQCIWNENIYTGESKCLLNLNTTADSPFNEIRVSDKTYYYIPLPNSTENALEYDCSKYDSSNCQNQQCQLSQEGVCLKKDSSDIRCSVNRSEPTYSYYDHKLELPSSISESLLNSHLECSKLQEDHINNSEYIGDPKGICINDSTLNPTLIHTGCVDSKDLNDLILHKSEDYINLAVTNAYLSELKVIDNVGECIDFNGDNIVNIDDLLELLELYGQTTGGDPDNGSYYIDENGPIDREDLLDLLNQFGRDCSDTEPGPEINNIGVTTNNNIIADHILSESCLSDHSDPSNCNIDESKSSKLIDNCRELCENNTDICNEYGVKFPTSIDDYSNSGCYLSKYCTEGGNSDCIPQPCTGVDQPYVGCIPNYIAFPDNHYCNMIHPFGAIITEEGSYITDNSCRIMCSQWDNCTGYQFNSATATRDQQCLIYGGATFGDVDTPSEGSYCYRKDI